MYFLKFQFISYNRLINQLKYSYIHSRLYSVPALKVCSNMCCSLRITYEQRLNYRTYSICAAGVLLFFDKKITDKTLQIVPQCGIIRGCATIFILICHYRLLHNIIAYKQLQYIATYFSSKEFVLTRQWQFKHAGLKRYMVSLLNNIQNFDRLLAA